MTVEESLLTLERRPPINNGNDLMMASNDLIRAPVSDYDGPSPSEALIIASSDYSLVEQLQHPAPSAPAVLVEDEDEDDNGMTRRVMRKKDQSCYSQPPVMMESLASLAVAAADLDRSRSSRSNNNNTAAPTATTSSTSMGGLIRRPVAMRVVRPRPISITAAVAEAATSISSTGGGGDPAAADSHPQQETTTTSTIGPLHCTSAAPVAPPLLAAQRPQPQRASASTKAVEKFYEQAHAASNDITGAEVHQAVMEAHEWHRKWTNQEETGHGYNAQSTTNPNTTTTTTVQSNGLPSHYAYNPEDIDYDRMGGARNPSPDDGSSDNFIIEDSQDYYERNNSNKREFSTASTMLLQAATTTSAFIVKDDDEQEQEDPRRAGKRQAMQLLPQDHAPAEVEDEDDEVLIRPVPVRISRPHAYKPKNHPALPMYVGGVIPSNDSMHAAGGFLHHQDSSKGSNTDPTTTAPSSTEEDEEGVGGGPFTSSAVAAAAAAAARANTVSPLTLCSSKYSSPNDDDASAIARMVMVGCENRDREAAGPPLENILSSPVRAMSIRSPSSSSLSSMMMMVVDDPDCARARDGLLQALAADKGETSSEQFQSCLQELQDSYKQNPVAASQLDELSQGLWLTLTKPTFFGQLDENDNGDPMYTLGRMAFDMFTPTNLVVSLQGNFMVVEPCEADKKKHLQAVPKSLQEEVDRQPDLLRTYNIVSAFTIEPGHTLDSDAYPNAPNKDVHQRPIHGIMTTYGYTLPDPNEPNRQSVWITGGRIEPNNAAKDLQDWKRLFTLHPPGKHTMGQKAMMLAMHWLMGANTDKCQQMDPEDGSFEYEFTRPLGGHGKAYVDTLFVDSSLRVVRGHRGTTFVFAKLPDKQHAAEELLHKD